MDNEILPYMDTHHNVIMAIQAAGRVIEQRVEQLQKALEETNARANKAEAALVETKKAMEEQKV